MNAQEAAEKAQGYLRDEKWTPLQQLRVREILDVLSRHSDATRTVLADWRALAELVPKEFVEARLGRYWPTIVAEYITSLAGSARCSSRSSFGCACDGQTGHAGPHHGRMRDHGKLHDRCYTWGFVT